MLLAQFTVSVCVMSFNSACAGPCLRVYPWLLVAVWHNRGHMLKYNSHCSYMYMITCKHLLYLRIGPETTLSVL